MKKQIPLMVVVTAFLFYTKTVEAGVTWLVSDDGTNLTIKTDGGSFNAGTTEKDSTLQGNSGYRFDNSNAFITTGTLYCSNTRVGTIENTPWLGDGFLKFPASTGREGFGFKGTSLCWHHGIQNPNQPGAITPKTDVVILNTTVASAFGTNLDAGPVVVWRLTETGDTISIARANAEPDNNKDRGLDSGGGKAIIGTLTNHSSIGGSFASSVNDAGSSTIRSGLIEVLYAGAVPSDSDENGLLDAWEREHFGYIGVDPLGDIDGDANSNLMEFLAGTNPKDNKSNFKPPGSHDGSIHTIPIQTIDGRKYEVFVSRNMKDWYLQSSYTGDGTQKVFSFDETTMPAGPLHSETHPSKYFFRVKITIL